MQIAYCQLDYETTPGEADNDEILREEIKKAMIALESAYCGFDNATGPDLIDCYIFEINALQKRYNHLIDLADTKAYQEEPVLYQHSPIRTLVSHVFG